MLTLKDIAFEGKTVFLRVDFNVPIDKEGKITDDTRIKAALPTLNYLLEKGSKVVAASHLGRPKGNFDPSLSLKPVSKRLAELLDKDVELAPDVIGDEVESMKKRLKIGDILLLENLRFYSEEKANEENFALTLARGIDIYVNDAFGACHRAHASIVGIPRFVNQAAAGFLLEKEIHYLQKIIRTPEKPLVAILGGAKVSDKIPVIENLLDQADSILIGGAMAYTFFAAQGKKVGRSLVEEDKKELSLELLQKVENKKLNFLLPIDHVIAEAPKEDVKIEITADFPIPANMMALDIGPQTRIKYKKIISHARTIFWNGPMGVFEIEKFAEGTKEIACAVANSPALSVIGGGDSVAAVIKAGVSDKISHMSTGGGASLEYIAMGTLPGLEALEEKK